MAVVGRDQRVVSLSTAIGQDQFVLAGFTGTEGISQLFRFSLDLLAENDRTVVFDRLIGQPASIDLSLPQGGSRFFSGIVARISQGARGPRFTSYAVELVPRLWLLTRRQGSRIFQHKTVPDIVREVIGDASDVDDRIQGGFEQRNYCVQYRESDFNFVSRLMEEEGIFYFFRHEQGKHTLVLGNTPAAHADVPGTRVVLFDANGSSKTGAITDWTKTQELRSGKFTLRDHNFELPDSNLEASALIQQSVIAGQVTHLLRIASNDKLELYDFPGGYAQRFDGIDKGGHEQPEELQKVFPEARRTVAIRMAEEAMQSLVIQGSSDCRQLTGGHRFTLSGHFNADGGYVITSVVHAARVHDPQAGSLTYANQFTCIPQALPYRPTRTTPRPTIPGTQTAVVVRPADAEIYPDKYGRVKVQFHWDREGKKDEDSSCWIRVAQPLSGSGQGMFWIPEKDDEVLVAFEHGDPDRPYIVGSLFNPRRPPPRTAN